MPSINGAVRLIINADDFGLTEGVNRAVSELYAAGALTSATLMANGQAFTDAASSIGPGVGCHIVLVDGTPVSPIEQIPSLLDAGHKGNLRNSLAGFVTDLQRGKICEREIEIEATAQIRRLQSTGVRVTHIDTHKHTHLFPRVARAIMRAAITCGIPAIRNPFEQAWSARLTRGAIVRKLEVAALRHFQQSFQQVRRAANLRTTDGSIGVSATGKLNTAALQRLIDNIPPGTWELVCHPGYNDKSLDQIRTRLRSTRDIEREALLQLIPAAARSGNIQLINFADL